MKRPMVPLKVVFTRVRGRAKLFGRKPMLSFNMLRHRLLKKVTGKPILRTIDIAVTGKCNFNCVHCYAEVFNEEKPIELNILEKFIDEAIQMGVFHFVLQGGEAIIEHERLKAIIKLCRPHRCYITVVSNGWAMNRETILELKRLSVDKIAISLDSMIPEEHDTFRNRPGSWQRAIQALSDIVEAGLHTSISTTITHQNLQSDGIQGIFDFAEKHGYRVDVQIAQPAGKWEGALDYLIDEEDAAWLLKRRDSSKVSRNGQIIINRDIYPRAGTAGCPAVKEFMSLNVAGEVMPCTFIQASLGNIKDKSLREMREAALRNPYFQNYNPVCLSGEDRSFIGKYLQPYIGKKKPMNAYEVFNL